MSVTGFLKNDFVEPCSRPSKVHEEKETFIQNVAF